MLSMSDPRTGDLNSARMNRFTRGMASSQSWDEESE